MNKCEVLKSTKETREIQTNQVKNVIYKAIKEESNKGFYEKFFTISIWFNKMNKEEFLEFLEELKEKGFSTKINKRNILSINWK